MNIKHIFIIPLVFLALFFAASTEAADVYQFDSNHTYVSWYVNRFGFGRIAGRFTANGTLILDQQHLQNSKVNVVIHMDDLSTGDPSMDNFLKGPTFFNAAQYPTATFVSTRVQLTSNSAAIVYGMLTLHGYQAPVVLHVTLSRLNPSYQAKKIIAFSAAGSVNRATFGITNYFPAVTNQVFLDIEALARSKGNGR